MTKNVGLGYDENKVSQHDKDMPYIKLNNAKKKKKENRNDEEH